jgi:hypothetical protein
VLQAIEAEVGESCRVRDAGDTDDAAHAELLISHATRDRREIYLTETGNGVLQEGVGNLKTEGTIVVADRADPEGGYPEFLRQRRHRCSAL